MKAAVLVHRSPRDCERVLWEMPIAGRREVARATHAARQALRPWRHTGAPERAALLLRFSRLLGNNAAALATLIAEEVGKPISQAAAEIDRTQALLEDVAGRSAEPLEVASSADAHFRYRPLGVVGVVSPWNNPIAIPVGKIGPALLYGNTVVWKPAPAGTALAERLVELFLHAGCPHGVVTLIAGDENTAQLVAGDDAVDAVTLSGSATAGRALQDICARRCVPFQAELGGNNAAIVWDDADLTYAARDIAEAAFAFAGQRCTANRRVIVASTCYDRFLDLLQAATATLVWGDPLAADTQVGPLISFAKRERVAAVVQRAFAVGSGILVPHGPQANHALLKFVGAYYPPTIVCVDVPRLEIVQEETFGPVLVVQRAADFDQAIALCNGVRQGLVAALFSASAQRQQVFLDQAQAGIVKINRATASADHKTPFGGWKASGVGPPEHGPSDREFFTRTQAVYRA